MKTYFVAHSDFETDSLKAAKRFATLNRYYNGRLVVPTIYIHLTDGRDEIAAVGEFNRRTGRTKWEEVY